MPETVGEPVLDGVVESDCDDDSDADVKAVSEAVSETVVFVCFDLSLATIKKTKHLNKKSSFVFDHCNQQQTKELKNKKLCCVVCAKGGKQDCTCS